jgi:hypothetical protein
MTFILDENGVQITLSWKSLLGAMREITKILKEMMPLLMALAALIAAGVVRGWW